MENRIEFDTRKEREAQREKIKKERSEENVITRQVRKIKEEIKRVVDAEGYIGAGDMALFHAAGCSKEEIDWIAEVKLASSKEAAGELCGYDLVRLYAMLNKDIKEFGHDMISDRTEEYLDEILARIAMRYENLKEMIEQIGPEKIKEYISSVYEARLVQCFNQFKSAKNAKDKFIVLTKWLTIIHDGGNREVLALFGGYPVPNRAGREMTQRYQQDFLSRLNNLGADKGNPGA